MAGKYKRKARKASGKGVVAVLRRARALVKRGWCQNHIAVTASGIRCHETSRRAKQWCAVGAIYAAVGEDRAKPAFDVVASVIRTRDIARWNDRQGRTQADAVALFDKAIAKAEAER